MFGPLSQQAPQALEVPQVLLAKQALQKANQPLIAPKMVPIPLELQKHGYYDVPINMTLDQYVEIWSLFKKNETSTLKKFIGRF